MYPYESRSFYRRSYRSAPPKLVPAIISCQGSVCLMFFGIFFLIAGCMARAFSNDSLPNTFPNDFHESHENFMKGPRLIGTILLVVSSVFIIISIIGFVVAFVLYRNYERERRVAMISTPSPHTFSNPQTFGSLTIQGVDYPTQAGYQYPTGYQALSQNVVYNPTTEPNQPIINS